MYTYSARCAKSQTYKSCNNWTCHNPTPAAGVTYLEGLCRQHILCLCVWMVLMSQAEYGGGWGRRKIMMMMMMIIHLPRMSAPFTRAIIGETELNVPEKKKSVVPYCSKSSTSIIHRVFLSLFFFCKKLAQLLLLLGKMELFYPLLPFQDFLRKKK